jgi:glycosidase
MGMMIGNHDVARFASVSAGSSDGDPWTPTPQPLDPEVYAKQRAALATVLTVPGAPILYYGDEVGLAGRTDPDSRRVMPAEATLLPAQRETRDLVGRLGRTRACAQALRRGVLKSLLVEPERFVFARELDGDAASMVIVSVARRPKLEVTVTLPAGAPQAWVDVVTGERVTSSGGELRLGSDRFGVHVYLAESDPCASAAR